MGSRIRFKDDNHICDFYLSIGEGEPDCISLSPFNQITNKINTLTVDSRAKYQLPINIR